MKQLLLVLSMALSIMSASAADAVFRHIDNFDKKTTVVVEVRTDNFRNDITNMVFHNGGKAYECKSLQTTFSDGVLTITASFKSQKTFNRCFLSFLLNGRDIIVDVPDHGKYIRPAGECYTVTTSGSPSKYSSSYSSSTTGSHVSINTSETFSPLRELSKLGIDDDSDPADIQDAVNKLYSKGVISTNTKFRIGGRYYAPSRK